MRLSQQEFNELYTMHELHYDGISVDLSGIPKVISKQMNIWDNADDYKQQKMITTLNNPLDDHFNIHAKRSDYVVYAAIDLMNLVYTREFKTNGLNQIAVNVCLQYDNI